jgi:hypothetical protein
MADFVFGPTKYYGNTATGYESLTSNFEFLTISTAIPIYTFAQVLASLSVTVATATANQLAQARASQAALDKLIQVVSERGQPVIMGAIALATGTYSVIMAIEHPLAWQVTATTGLAYNDPRSNEDLVSKIKADGINYGFGTNVSALVYNDPIGGGSYSLTVDDSSTLAVAYSAVLT